MAEGVGIFIIFVGLLAIKAVLFGGWLLITLLRFVLRGIAAGG
jgi:hypothetical protein